MRNCAPVLAILAAVASGCGGDGGGGPATVPVHGRVTLDGKPLGLKSVVFVPEAGTPGDGASAVTKEDGSYSLLAIRPGSVKKVDGVAPGSYVVVVAEPPMSAPGASGDKGEPGPAVPAHTDVKRQKPSIIPQQYSGPGTSKLRVKVPPNGGTVDLELTARP